jgi:hypothetical protein
MLEALGPGEVFVFYRGGPSLDGDIRQNAETHYATVLASIRDCVDWLEARGRIEVVVHEGPLIISSSGSNRIFEHVATGVLQRRVK